MSKIVEEIPYLKYLNFSNRRRWLPKFNDIIFVQRHIFGKIFMKIRPQGQYWIEYYLVLTTAPPYMAAANFVVITNGGGSRSLEQPISTNSVPRAIVPRVAIGGRLSLKIDLNLEGSLSVATWDDTAWIGGTTSGTSYISVDSTDY